MNEFGRRFVTMLGLGFGIKFGQHDNRQHLTNFTTSAFCKLKHDTFSALLTNFTPLTIKLTQVTTERKTEQRQLNEE